jgi:putative transposase
VRIETAIIDLGKPRQNGTNPSIKGMFRDGCPSVDGLRARREAQGIIEAWRQHYNTVRPDSSLGHLTPLDFRRDPPSMQDHAIRAIVQDQAARRSGGRSGQRIQVAVPAARRVRSHMSLA